MTFRALELALEIVSQLRKPTESLRRYDNDLAKQIRRAGSSLALNLAEGNRRRGKDRTHFFRIAAGSASEVRTALKVACAWGYLKRHDLANLDDQLDHYLATLYKLTR